MATPKHTSITVTHNAYKTFMFEKMEEIKKTSDLNLSHSKFLLRCLAQRKKKKGGEK